MSIRERGILVHPEDLTLDWIERMYRADLNLLGLHPVGGPQAHTSLEKAIRKMQDPSFLHLIDEAHKRGIKVEFEAHALKWLLPETLFSKHPDWFRMNAKGERFPDFNLCVSSSDALDYIAESASRLAACLNTGSHKYFYWLDDVIGCFCHCPDCLSLSPSDQQMIVLNAMLKGLRKVDPEAQLCYIAYHDTLNVPRKVIPEAGVFLEYAPIERDHHHPICDANCEKNVRESHMLPDLISFFGAENSRVLEYWMDNSLFSNWTKPPRAFFLDKEIMKRDLDYYASLGFESVTSFGCYLGPDYEELYGKASLDEYGSVFKLL